MQTPGRRTQSRTPMFQIGRRMNFVGRNLSNISEETKIERPQIRILGRVISQLDSMNNNLRDMSSIIRRDVDSKQKYYREELKILKKDSENLKNTNTRLFNFRKGLASATGAIAVGQLATGNIGGAAQSFGASAALMSPEIIQFITGSIVNSLALRGLVGNRGAGVNTVSRVAGASKFKNPLLITAALAASFLIPALAKSNQSADKRRLELSRRTIRGAETINKDDVARFRSQLDRFDKILSTQQRDKKKQVATQFDDEVLKDEKPSKGAPDGFFGNLKESFTNLISKGKEGDKEIKNEEGEKRVNKLSPGGFIDGILNFFKPKDRANANDDQNVVNNNIIEEGDNQFISQLNPNLDFSSEITENKIFNDNISNIFPNNVNVDRLVINDEIPKTTESTKSEPNISFVKLGSDDDGKSKSSSGFVGESAKRTTVSVSTKFNSSGGAIDKIDYASSLRAPVFS